MRKYVFADEAGDLTFTRNQNVSRYFIVCTVAMDDCFVGDRLLELRRQLTWEKLDLGEYFHASENKQIVRDRVFDLIRQCDFTVDATILEKSKAQPQTRETAHRFYQYGWYYHMKHIAPRLLNGKTEMLITAAAIGTKRERAYFNAAINDVAQQTSRDKQFATAFPPSSAEPCLQVADYCAWAIRRKWEMQDLRSYRLISDKIVREYDLWKRGTTHHY